MRILMLSDESHDASMGGPKVALKLRQELTALGHGCDLLFRPDLGDRPRNPRLRLAVSPWLARQAADRALRRAAAAGVPYDVIDAASAEGWLLPRRAGGPAVVARSHGLEHRYYQALLEDARSGLIHKPLTHRMWFPAVRLTQVAAALRRADRVIALNRADRARILARGWQPAERVEIVPHGVDAARWAQAPDREAPRGQGILFCGWWTTSKGVAYLAQAYAQLWQRGLKIPLTLLGAGSGPGFEAPIRAALPAAAQPLLRVLPRTADEDAVFAAYRSHDLLVCPSTSEGFGLVVVEAMSQRLPVICSREVGAADLLTHAQDSWVVPARDAAALAAAMAHLWTDPRLRGELGEHGYRRCATLHWSAVAARTAACYAAAIRVRGSVAAARGIMPV